MRLSTFSGTVAFSLLADACHEMGDHAGALTVVDEGIAKANSSGEVWWLSELLRPRGESLLNLGKGQLEAEYTFGLALKPARRQNAVTLVTRSIASLSRQMHDTGRAAEADELQAGLVSKT